jgi:hypothetical protein
MLTRLENFGPGGLNADLYDTALGGAQWSELVNVDIRDGDLYSAGEDVLRAETPCLPLYCCLYPTPAGTIDVISDGQDVYASVEGSEWYLLGTNFAGAISFAFFKGCLIVNDDVLGPFYWCSFLDEDEVDTWNFSADETWNGGSAISWETPLSTDTWNAGSDLSWDSGLDEPWDGQLQGQLMPLPGWPEGAVAKQIISYRDQLVAIGGSDPSVLRSQENSLIRWSSLAGAGEFPNSWTPSAGNFAGFAFVQDTPGVLGAAALMRDDLIIYKTDSIYRLTATGDPDLPMRLERIMTCNGVQSPANVAVCAEVHFAVTKRGFAVFDGNQFRHVDFGRVQSLLARNVTGNYLQNAVAVFYEPQQEVWIGIKEAPDSRLFDVILKYNTQHDAFTLHDYSGKGLLSLTAGRVNDQTRVSDPWDGGPDYTWDENNITWSNAQATETSSVMMLGLGPEFSEIDLWDAGDGAAWDNGPDIIWDNADPVGSTALYSVFGLPRFVDGSAKQTSITRRGVRLSEQARHACVRALFPEMEGGAVTWELGQTWYPSQDEQDINWQLPRSFTPGSRRKIPLRVLGDTFALRMTSVDVWRLHAVGLDHEVVGKT